MSLTDAQGAMRDDWHAVDLTLPIRWSQGRMRGPSTGGLGSRGPILHHSWRALGLALALAFGLGLSPARAAGEDLGQAARAAGRVPLLSWPAPSADVAWDWLETPHVRIAYLAEQRPQADWYLAFVERVYAEVTDLFATSLDQPVVVRLYPTEQAYVEANPAARAVPGILAHARPSGNEIGMALTRIEALTPAERVDAFRHELTHVVMAARSGDRLPPGWHEGLAQYVQREPGEHQQAVSLLRRAVAEGTLLDWATFEQAPTFYPQAAVAYPESYAGVAYLADRYGFRRFLVFLDALRGGADTQQALEQTFSHPAAELEAEWRAALPDLLRNGWPEDALQGASLAPAQQALAAGRYADAAQLAERSERFWSDLGRDDRAGQAAELRTQAEGRNALDALLGSARERLAAFDYAGAEQEASTAAAQAAELVDPGLGTAAEQVRQAAERGVATRAALATAESARNAFQFGEARRDALEAAQGFREMGDEEDAQRADAVAADATALPQRIGGGLIGAAVLLTALALGLTTRRRVRSGSARPADAFAPDTEGFAL